MATPHRVRLGPSLRDAVERWSDEDQEALLGLKAALADDGFDVICGALTGRLEALTVEFVEPGETPDMVWARVFLKLDTQLYTLHVHQRGGDILLETG